MIYWFIGYWIIAAIYCGASVSIMRINNVSLLVLGLFAPVLCWVVLGVRLARGGKK